MPENSKSKCQACYPPSLSPALTLENFDILTEWMLGVPLPVQIVLERFVNKASLVHAKDKVKYMRKKLDRMFFLYHAFLNCLNQRYLGILQSATSDELLMNYKTVGTVFDITCNAGISSSLKTAESLLKQNADDDRQYFKYF